jgi:hypothetical protein
MSDESNPSPGETPAPDPNAPWTQEVRHSQVTALVPESVSRGVFSTGAIVIEGAHEFIVDFLLRMASPQQVAARAILPIPVVPQLISALRENLRNYESRFGPPPTIKMPPGSTTQTSIQEVYEQLKLPEDVLSGAYANAVMIGHTPTEFSFDFITTFFPRSAVSCRVFMAAPNVPRFLESLQHAFDKYQQKHPPRRPEGPPETPPESGPSE